MRCECRLEWTEGSVLGKNGSCDGMAWGWMGMVTLVLFVLIFVQKSKNVIHIKWCYETLILTFAVTTKNLLLPCD